MLEEALCAGRYRKKWADRRRSRSDLHDRPGRSWPNRKGCAYFSDLSTIVGRYVCRGCAFHGYQASQQQQAPPSTDPSILRMMQATGAAPTHTKTVSLTTVEFISSFFKRRLYITPGQCQPRSVKVGVRVGLIVAIRSSTSSLPASTAQPWHEQHNGPWEAP
jgi:hypothetical protein